MPSWKEHFGGFLKKDDVPKPVRVVVDSVELEDVKGDDGEISRKLVAHIGGMEKGLILNRTNCEELEMATNTTDFERWGGQRMVLFVDPDVKFGGKKVGGLRLRLEKKKPPPEPELPPEPPPITDDDIPF